MFRKRPVTFLSACLGALPIFLFSFAPSASAQAAQAHVFPRGGVAELSAKGPQRRQGDLFSADDDVQLHYLGLQLRADHMEYNAATSEALARGHVVFDYKNQHIEAAEAHYNVQSGVGKFTDVRGTIRIDRRPNVTVLVTENPLYFEAREIQRRDESTYVLSNVWLTVCDPNRPKWKFFAQRATVHLDETVALVHANFRLFRVPLIYLPYATAPAGRRVRQTGFLLPDVGQSSRKGFVFGDAFYWAPSTWMDATLGAQYLSRRGWSQNAEVRARPTENTRFNYTYFGVRDRGLEGPNGVRLPQGGHKQHLEAGALLPHGWRAVAEFNQLSSLTFRLAFAESFGEAVNADVRSAFFVSNNFRGFSLNFAALNDKNFLTIQPETSVVIRSAPEVRFSSREQTPWKRWPIYLAFDSFAGALHRKDAAIDTPAAVQRSEIAPRVSVPLHWGSWLGVTTTAAFRATRYGSELLNGSIAGHSFTRQTGEFSVDLLPPAFERVWQGFGAKWKHTIEPRITYNYITGVHDFSRFIRFDADDTLTNTREVEYGITQRLYRKQGTDQADQFLTWRLVQKHYFDPTFGGALVTGQRNVFAALNSLTPFAFADTPRHWSPIVSTVKVTPGGRYDGELIMNYDTQRNRLTAVGTLLRVRPYREAFLTLAHFNIKSDAVVQPFSNQVRALLGYGDFNRKGFNMAGGFSYDIAGAILQNQLVQVSYNGSCCGLALEYRRLNLSSVRVENQFRVAFIIANIGTFGNLRRQEKIF